MGALWYMSGAFLQGVHPCGGPRLRPLDYYGGGAASMLQEDVDMTSAMQQPAPPVKHSKASGAGGSILDILEAPWVR